MFATETGQLSQLFQNMLHSLVAVFDITRRSPPRPNVIEINDDIVSELSPRDSFVPPCIPVSVLYTQINRGGARGGRRTRERESGHNPHICLR